MKERKKVLWVIGDSTLSSFNDKYYYPRYGYGTKLAAYLDDAVEVKNIALSGRSSKSYTTEPQYKELTGGMQKGDFLLIGLSSSDTMMKRRKKPVSPQHGGTIKRQVHLRHLYMIIILYRHRKPAVR